MRLSKIRLHPGHGMIHVVFTLPAAITDIACQNKAVIYDLLFKGIGGDPGHHRGRPKAPRLHPSTNNATSRSI
jgi:hypothetical protein